MEYTGAFINPLEPVVKSCERLPTEITRSAPDIIVLSELEPVTPIDPRFCSSYSTKTDFPACVATSGILVKSKNFFSSFCASLYFTPPPAITTGFFDFFSE